MKLLSLKIHSLSDVFIQELRDIYSAEDQLVDALPKMAAAASSSELKQGFEHHLKQTKEHVARLENIFEGLGLDPSGESCEAMEGLISEGKDYISAEGDPAARDVGLISIAQKVEHYEISAYGTLRTLAKYLGNSEAVNQLQQTLDEEAATDQKLTGVSERILGSGSNKAE